MRKIFQKKNAEEDYIDIDSPGFVYEAPPTTVRFGSHTSIGVKEDYEFVLEYIERVKNRKFKKDWVFLTPHDSYHGRVIAIKVKAITSVADTKDGYNDEYA